MKIGIIGYGWTAFTEILDIDPMVTKNLLEYNKTLIEGKHNA